MLETPNSEAIPESEANFGDFFVGVVGLITGAGLPEAELTVGGEAADLPRLSKLGFLTLRGDLSAIASRSGGVASNELHDEFRDDVGRTGAPGCLGVV